MLSVVMLFVIMLFAIMLSVVMLSGASGPSYTSKYIRQTCLLVTNALAYYNKGVY
jgi:hypothetical protein